MNNYGVHFIMVTIFCIELIRIKNKIYSTNQLWETSSAQMAELVFDFCSCKYHQYSPPELWGPHKGHTCHPGSQQNSELSQVASGNKQTKIYFTQETIYREFFLF